MHRIGRDPRLRAELVRSTPLLYRAVADASQDRPAHVRAGSALARVGERLVVVQDDAGFLAAVAPDGQVEAVPLPAGDGVRQWDEGRGNKPLKPDLEAAVALDGMLIAFGSGSTPRRERVLIAAGRDLAEPRWVPCPELYAALRACTAFSGSEMNLEAAAVVGGALRLFNRGNGAPSGALRPVNATCDLDLGRFLGYLAGDAEAPSPERVRPYDLGILEGAPLGFTDAAIVGGTLLFSAAAEASPDTYRDGPVAGSAVGLLAGDGGAWAPILTPDGAVYRGKVEGIAPGDAPGRLLAVVDHDRPDQPSDLCQIELTGPWPFTPA